MIGSGKKTLSVKSKLIQLIMPTAAKITKTASMRISTPRPKNSLTALKSFVARDMRSPVFCFRYHVRSKVKRCLNSRFRISNSIFREEPNIYTLHP